MQIRRFLAPLLALPGLCAAHPSFDCDKAKTEVEKLICADETLANLDKALATLYAYTVKHAAAEDAKALRQSQQVWLKKRDHCTPSDRMQLCLDQAMTARHDELRKQRDRLLVRDLDARASWKGQLSADGKILFFDSAWATRYERRTQEMKAPRANAVATGTEVIGIDMTGGNDHSKVATTRHVETCQEFLKAGAEGFKIGGAYQLAEAQNFLSCRLLVILDKAMAPKATIQGPAHTLPSIWDAMHSSKHEAITFDEEPVVTETAISFATDEASLKFQLVAVGDFSGGGHAVEPLYLVSEGWMGAHWYEGDYVWVPGYQT